MNGARWRDDTGFEGKCDYCLDWWPLTLEFWYPKTGLKKCKACHLEARRLWQTGLRADEARYELVKARRRTLYADSERRARRLAATRAWKAANRDKVLAYSKAYYRRNREAMKEKARTYYDECREAVLIQKREYHNEKKVREAAA
jgi:hypothetical protein